MASVFQKLLGMGGRQVAKRSSTAANSIDDISKELVEQGPEVIGKGTSRGAKEVAEEIPDAVFKEIDPNAIKKDMSWLDRMDPRLKSFIKGGAAGGGAGYVASELFPFEDEEQPSKSTPIIPSSEPLKAEEPKKPEDIKKELKKTVKTEEPKTDGLAVDAEIKKEEAINEYEEAKNRSNDNAMMALLGKAATQIGGGIASLGAGSQVKIDGSGFDDLLKMSDRPLEQLKGKQQHEKLKADLDDEKAMRDPNSEISKMVTGIAQKVGILKPGQSASAMALKNAGVNLGTLLATIEAGNARRDAAALSRDLRSDEKATAREFKAEEDRKKREDKRKLVTEEIEARKRTIGDNIKRARDIVEKYGTVEATGPQSELLQGMLDEIAVDTAKLQDPDSVARPAEVQLVRQSLIPEDTLGRMSMTNKTAKTILDEFEKRINERAATGYKVRGIDQPTDNNSGGMVKVQAPNGKIKLIPAEQVDSALAAGGKLVE